MAAGALLATRGRLPGQRQVRLRGRGGVELGPPRRLARRRARNASRADVAIISDTGFFEGNLPAITLSLRGLMYAQIDVVGTAVDLHSGSYGGAVQNPANALARIIAGLKGPDGRIRVPGFYDDVVPLSEADRAALAALPVRRGGVPGAPRAAGARRRGRASRRSSGARPARRSTSTASGAASRARAARRSSRPTPTPRSAAGWWPRRIRTGSSRPSAPTSRRSRRPA